MKKVWLFALMVAFRRQIRAMDAYVGAHRIPGQGLILLIWRVIDYSFACTFDWCARRSKPQVDFRGLSAEVKRPFVLLCLTCLAGLLAALFVVVAQLAVTLLA